MSLCSVVIVYYSGYEVLTRCIDSIPPEVELIVVDTSPASDTSGRLERGWVITAPENHGYGWACNLGIRAASAPVVIVSNSDVVFAARAIESLAGVASDSAVICAPLQVHDSLPTMDNVQPGVGLGVSTARWTGIGMTSWRRRRKSQLHTALMKNATVLDPPFTLSGACLAADASVWRRLGGFNERIWLYNEDAEFSARARENGVDLLLVSQAVIEHVSGTNSRPLTRDVISALVWSEQIAARSLNIHPIAALRIIHLAGSLLRCVRSLVLFRTSEAAMWAAAAADSVRRVAYDPRSAHATTPN